MLDIPLVGLDAWKHMPGAQVPDAYPLRARISTLEKADEGLDMWKYVPKPQAPARTPDACQIPPPHCGSESPQDPAPPSEVSHFLCCPRPKQTDSI